MTIEELDQIAESVRAANARFDYEVNVCMGTGCLSQHSDQLKDALNKEAEAQGKNALIRRTGCMGLCAAGPLVLCDPDEILYQHVKADNAAKLVASLGGKPVAELQCELREHFDQQVHIVLENSGHIDPERIDDYIAHDGYRALLTALNDMTPNGVIRQITESGLRGRGGGGYPTGLKWNTVAKAPGDVKYIICNGDEGDPGAFMDRSVLESDPQRVIEGMAIAAYAVGASKGFVYVRAEYPLAVARLTACLRDARRRGLLGNNIGNTPFNFDVEIRLGAGAFVCGEETALIASIEGRRGTPRPRPPYPAVSGLYGKPTLINNVETFANIAPIIRKGGRWFASIGSERSKGTKVFAITGKITNTGLVEVPMGIKLREIIEVIRPNRRTLRRLPPRGDARHRRQLRRPGQSRLHHGFRRHDRHGRHFLHGQRRPLLHRVLHDRVLRQVHSLPRRHRANAHPAHPHLRGARHHGRSRTARRAL
jgi:bidirectional [NiFe] hydrogenase diaphorase subunit